jgi:WD40 repeat protein
LLAFSGATASGERHIGIALWDVASQRTVGATMLQGRPVEWGIFSLDGRTLALLEEGNIWLVDVAEQKASGPYTLDNTNVLVSLVHKHNDVRDLVFSPNGKMLAISTGRLIRLWDVGTHREIAKPFIVGPLTQTQNYITSMAFSPDSKTIAAADNDGTITLWNATHR